MLSKNSISLITSLHKVKYRKEQQCFIAEGPKLVSELLKSALQVKSVCALPEWIRENHKLVEEKNINCTEITSAELSKISALVTPNQVLAVASLPSVKPLPVFSSEMPLPMLDAIRDPGNLGTIIRVCDWFGIDDLICSDDCTDAFSPKVVQASMGSVFRVNIHYVSPVSFLSELKGKVPVYGAFLNGNDATESKLVTPSILIIGNESAGISEALSQYVSERISVPGYASRKANTRAESLNASVAASILIYEFFRNYR